MILLRMALLVATLYAGQFCLAEYVALPEVRYSYAPTGELESVSAVDANGRLHGELTRYYPDGTLRVWALYDHGQWLHIQHFAPNGQLRSESMESGGFATVTRFWSEDGTPLD